MSSLAPYAAYCLLFGAAVAGSALNAVAGGGSFFTFPALLWAGVPLLPANATSTAALWPGMAASAVVNRAGVGLPPRALAALAAVSGAGSAAGTGLLLLTPPELLRRLLPYLLLTATLLLAFRREPAPAATAAPVAPRWVGLLGQFGIAVYGGYFGGGMGILMLAVFSLLGLGELPRLNALKTVLAACINGVGLVLFALAQQIVWSYAAVMVGGAVLGGYGGARLGARLAPALLQRLVVGIGLLLTAWFFVH